MFGSFIACTTFQIFSWGFTIARNRFQIFFRSCYNLVIVSLIQMCIPPNLFDEKLKCWTTIARTSVRGTCWKRSNAVDLSLKAGIKFNYFVARMLLESSTTAHAVSHRTRRTHFQGGRQMGDYRNFGSVFQRNQERVAAQKYLYRENDVLQLE